MKLAPYTHHSVSATTQVKREAMVFVAQLHAELGIARLGPFTILDALGTRHKSEPSVGVVFLGGLK